MSGRARNRNRNRESGPSRLFVVGTDTECGKTAVTCALLRSARAAGLRALPFKPAVSGPEGPESDPRRLLRAAGLPRDALATVAPLRFEAPLAPGVAEDRARFLDGDDDPARAEATLQRAVDDLVRAEREHDPDVTLIEGAGGLFVPMPGGTWLPRWIAALGAAPIVVGRLGLGTINHTLLTIDALRALGHAPLGFVLSETRVDDHDPSSADNPAIIARARALPCLGILPFTPGDDPAPPGWHVADLWRRLGVEPGHTNT